MEDLKSRIKAILGSTRKYITEDEFRKAWFENNATDFDDVLCEHGTNFFTFFLRIPDTATVQVYNNSLFLHRASSENSANEEKPTAKKISRNFKGPKLNIEAAKVSQPMQETQQMPMHPPPGLAPILGRNVHVVRPVQRCMYPPRVLMRPLPLRPVYPIRPIPMAIIRPIPLPQYSAFVPGMINRLPAFQQNRMQQNPVAAVPRGPPVNQPKIPARHQPGTSSSLPLFNQALKEIRETEQQVFATATPVESIPPSYAPLHQYGNKSWFKIRIIDVVSPACFTFQYSLDKLEELMQKMKNHYDNLRNPASYRAKDLRPEMLVAVRRQESNLWCRAEIMEISPEKISVRYIDYLTVTKKLHALPSSCEIYNLAKEFAEETPKSAVGSLHGLKPKTTRWCLNSKLQLIYSRNKEFMATIKKHENGVYALSVLIDAEKFHRMFDGMIQENLADVSYEDFLNLSSINQRTLV